MKWSKEFKDRVFARTDGTCHLDGAPLVRNAHGRHGRRGAWDVDHVRPKALGGRDDIRNLLPACTPCNRARQKLPVRGVRRRNGLEGRPLSLAAKEHVTLRNAVTGALAGAVVGGLVGGRKGACAGAVVAGGVGLLLPPNQFRAFSQVALAVAAVGLLLWLLTPPSPQHPGHALGSPAHPTGPG